jgi:AcrR family transcriptional regulator
MARPIQADANATRRRILDVASQLFSDKGASAVSVRDIAQNAGITLATVHHYFGTKELLYDACIQGMYAELESLRESLEPAFARGGSPSQLLEAAVRASFRFAIAHRGAIRLLMRTIVDSGELEPSRRANVHLPFLTRGGVILANIFDRDPHEMRLTVQSVMHLIVRYALTAPDELSLIAHAEDDAKAIRTIENHLVKVAFALIGAQAQTGVEEE